MIKEERETWIYDSGPVKVQGVDLDNKHPYGNIPSPTEWEVKPIENKYDFEIEYLGHSSQPLCEIFQSNEAHNHFVMYNSKNEMMVDVDLDDGTVIFGDTYTPDEAAKTFWDTISKTANNVSAPPGIADDMPEEYEIKLDSRTVITDAIPLAGWTLEEEECISEVDEDLVKDIVKDILSTHFDDTMKGLIDG